MVVLSNAQRLATRIEYNHAAWYKHFSTHPSLPHADALYERSQVDRGLFRLSLRLSRSFAFAFTARRRRRDLPHD